jgi:hypothetical protein
MTSQPVNILLTSFPGLSLPPTLSFSLPSTSTVADLTTRIATYLPASLPLETLALTTTNNKAIRSTADTILSTVSDDATTTTTTTSPSNLLPLRLSARLHGGKGGFGSQLRAAGGRMSSKRKRNQGEDNASSRNLDGRRLRTVNEAKALAEYLAVRPGMERKEKEERRRRWQAVVDAAERRQEELKNGGEGKGKQKVEGAWMEEREEVNEKARDAVVAAMREGVWTDNLREQVLGGSSSSASASASASGGSGSETPTSEEEDKMDEAPVSAEPAQKQPPRKFVGFDEDDEFMSDSEDEDTGKGKAKA